MPLAPRTRLGPYEIVAPLGQGGMGEVYRARDTRLDRDVAIKVLPRDLAETPDARARFEREARSIAALSHPNICALFDVGREGDTEYLVMELLEGETLASRLERGPLPGSEVLRLGAQIADALSRAHRQGLIHRDLKPGNVMLVRSAAKLLDFGLARPMGPGQAPGLTASPTVTKPLTAEGAIVGTFHYMSPEQLEGKEADARSDLWALGCVLYEMATGRRAFEGASQASLIGSIMYQQPASMGELAPLSPPGLERLVRACLSKDPDERVQTAHDAGLQLRWIAEGGPGSGVTAGPVAPPPPRHRVATAVASVLAIAALALGVALVSIAGRPEPVIRASVLAPPGTVLELQGRHPGPPVLSPDGRSIAFVARAPGVEPRLWVRPLDATAARALPGTEGAGYPFWSPDGKSLAFFSGGKLRRANLAGGPPLTICDAPIGKGGAWGRDGTILFAPGNLDPIHRVTATGGVSHPVTVVDTAAGENSHRFPQLLPDGRHFLYYARLDQARSDEVGSIMVGSLDGKGAKLLMHAGSQGDYAAGYLLFVRERALMAQRLDLGSLKLSGDPVPVADAVHVLATASRAFFTVSGGAALVYLPPAEDPVSRLLMVDRKGAVTDSIARGELVGRYRLSPDGRSAVGGEIDARTGLSDLWIHDLARHTRTRLTFDAYNDAAPLWSADGSHAIFASVRNGTGGIYRRAVRGVAKEETLLTAPVEIRPQSLSPGGRVLVYSTSTPRTREDLWLLPLEGDRRPRPLFDGPANEAFGEVSPDGRWVAYLSSESGQIEVYVTAFAGPGRKVQVSTGGGFAPAWRGDGAELYYQSFDQKLVAVPVQSSGFEPLVGQATPLFDLSDNAAFDVTRDGRHFLLDQPVAPFAQAPLVLVTNWIDALRRH